MQGPRPLPAPPELPAAPEGTPIFVVEGEKAADATRSFGEDATTEAIAPILQANPRGVPLARDELSGWFASFDRHSKSGVSGGDAAYLADGTVGETQTLTVDDPPLCLHAHRIAFDHPLTKERVAFGAEPPARATA